MANTEEDSVYSGKSKIFDATISLQTYQDKKSPVGSFEYDFEFRIP